jgi:hypothetical protein
MLLYVCLLSVSLGFSLTIQKKSKYSIDFYDRLALLQA